MAIRQSIDCRIVCTHKVGFTDEGTPQGADPLHPSSTVAKAGRNHLNEEITPLLATGIGERYSQTILNLGHAALLR